MTTLIAEAKAAGEAVKQVDEAIGILAKVVNKLKGQPDAAALKLAESLEEVGKTWQVMDQAINAFLALGFDPDALAKGSATLLGIESGALAVNVEKGRGHCHVIGNIFDEYVNTWFQRVFKGDELSTVSGVFYDLGNADDDVFSRMVSVAEQLQVEANAALDSIAQKRPADASARILALRGDLNPLRLSIANSMVKLYALKGEFIQIAAIA